MGSGDGDGQCNNSMFTFKNVNIIRDKYHPYKYTSTKIHILSVLDETRLFNNSHSG